MNIRNNVIALLTDVRRTILSASTYTRFIIKRIVVITNCMYKFYRDLYCKKFFIAVGVCKYIHIKLARSRNIELVLSMLIQMKNVRYKIAFLAAILKFIFLRTFDARFLNRNILISLFKYTLFKPFLSKYIPLNVWSICMPFNRINNTINELFGRIRIN